MKGRRCKKFQATMYEECELRVGMGRLSLIYRPYRTVGDAEEKEQVKKTRKGFCLRCGKHRASECNLCVMDRHIGIPCSNPHGKEGSLHNSSD